MPHNYQHVVGGWTGRGDVNNKTKLKGWTIMRVNILNGWCWDMCFDGYGWRHWCCHGYGWRQRPLIGSWGAHGKVSCQEIYLYTIFRNKMCQKVYYLEWNPVTKPYFQCTPFIYTSEKNWLTNLFWLID